MAAVLRAASPQGIHTSLIKHLCAEHGWADEQLHSDLLNGFPLIGDIPTAPGLAQTPVRRAQVSVNEVREIQVRAFSAKVLRVEQEKFSQTMWDQLLADVHLHRISSPVPASEVQARLLSRRFLVQQVSATGEIKERPIDDLSESMVNDLCAVTGRLRMGSLADLRAVLAFLQQRWPDQDLLLLKADFKAAYRSCGIRLSHLELSAVVIRGPVSPMVSVQHSMPFGAVSAVYAWDRLASFICHILIQVFLLPISRFVDDLFWAALGSEASESRQLVMRVVALLGFVLEPTKTPEPASQLDILGVECEVLISQSGEGKSQTSQMLLLRMAPDSKKVSFWSECLKQALSTKFAPH